MTPLSLALQRGRAVRSRFFIAGLVLKKNETIYNKSSTAIPHATISSIQFPIKNNTTTDETL